MEKNTDYNYLGMPPFGVNNMYDFSGESNMNTNSSPFDSNAMFNPLMQYEQAYMYYRYLTMQMEYKIKCKEYEKMVSKSDVSRDNNS